MYLRFDRENMYTASGFVHDSLLTDLPDFVAVAPTEFDAAFVTAFEAGRAKIKGATSGALRGGVLSQETTRLYQQMDAVKPLLDRLDIRLGFIAAADLTVPVKKFGLKLLRDRLAARDAEASSRALTVLEQAIADNLPVLTKKGYPAQELTDLKALHAAIDTGNAQQNQTLNANTGTTLADDADYLALDKLLGKVLRTGRLLYKSTKQKRQQYEVTAIMKRLQAAAKGPAGGTGGPTPA